MILSKIKQTLSANHIKIIHIVAFDNKNCIGKDNQLAWHIPEDLKHFKELTTNSVVIMGRKTYQSIGRPLPNRINWVITRDKDWTADGVKVAHSLETALEMASKDSPNGKVFIIGGGEIYRQTIAIADVLEISRVDLDIDGDTFYPVIPSEFAEVWRSDRHIDEKSKTAFEFVRYKRMA